MVAIPAATTVAIACLSYALGGRATTAEAWVNYTRQACEEIQRMETLEKIGRELEAAATAREEVRIAEQLERLLQFFDRECVAV